MFERIKKLLADEDGATVVEYALLVGLIACGLILSIGGLRDSIVGMFDGASDTLNGATPAP